MFSHLKPKLFNTSLQDIKKKKKETSIRSSLSSHTQELNELFREGIILPGQPGGGFEVGKATRFWTPAGLFLASKFAANSVVQGTSESFLSLDFPLAHHNFFHFRDEGLEFIAFPHGNVVRLTGGSQRFCGAFWTGLKGSNRLFDPKFLPTLPSLPLHSPNFAAGWGIDAPLSWEWLLNLSSFCSCSFYSPTLINWISFPKAA